MEQFCAPVRAVRSYTRIPTDPKPNAHSWQLEHDTIPPEPDAGSNTTQFPRAPVSGVPIYETHSRGARAGAYGCCVQWVAAPTDSALGPNVFCLSHRDAWGATCVRARY